MSDLVTAIFGGEAARGLLSTSIVWSMVIPARTFSAMVRKGIAPLNHAATVVACPSIGSHSSEIAALN